MKINADFEIDDDYIGHLQHLMSTDASFKKKLDDMIWDALGESRSQIQAYALSKIKNGDPRESVRSIRRSIYRKVAGGAISILGRGRSAGSRATQFKATGQSRRTQQINSYTGIDRDFILRFLNSGTADRVGGYGRNNRMDSASLYSHKGKPGWRGRIEPMNFMQQRFVASAISRLETEIETYLENTLK